MIIKEKKEIIFLVGLLLVASFFRFYQIERADITNDAATYAFRSIGYLDIMMSDIQTTPLVWFGYSPWWSKLSFHDAPPLVFLIQHLFFKILGVNLLVARLPFVIFGILTVLAFYFFVKELYGRKIASLAAIFLAVDPYHILASQSGLLEPILLFFAILSLWFFKKGLSKSKYLLLAGLFLGLSLLCKYSALFLFFIFGFVLIFNKEARKIIRSKNFYLGLFLFFLIISPLFVYNWLMYQERGHFEMQLAFLFGQKQTDWTSIPGRQIGANLAQNFLGVFEAIKNSSIIVYALFFISLIYLVIRLIFCRDKKHLFLFFSFLSIVIFFSLMGSGARYLVILPPFVWLIVTVFLFDIIERLPKLKYFIWGFLGLLIAYLVIFNLNSNQFVPLGKVSWAYSAYREENWGYNELEKIWTAKYQGIYTLKETKIEKITDTELGESLETIPALLEGNLLVYDDKMNWFAKEWYIYRWIVYWRIPFISTYEFTKLASQEGGLEFLNSMGKKNIIFIKATNKTFLDPGERNTSDSAEFMEKRLLEQGFEPIEIVKNPKNDEVFRIYRIPHLIKKQ